MPIQKYIGIELVKVKISLHYAIILFNFIIYLTWKIKKFAWPKEISKTIHQVFFKQIYILF
jgi:hypothetical protein